MRIQAKEISERAGVFSGHPPIPTIPEGAAPLAHRCLRNAEGSGNFLLGQAALTQGSFEVDDHGGALYPGETRVGKHDLACVESLSSGSVPSACARSHTLAMPTLPETPEEIEARHLAQLQEQARMVENIPLWLRKCGLKQKDVANALGVSEGTVSKWLHGEQGMSVGQLRQIAVLVGAHPGDLLRPPGSSGMGEKVEQTLKLMDQLSDEEWQRILATAEAIAAAKAR